MLRRTPSTLLVCLAFFASTILTGLAVAADPQEALDVLLKSNDASASTAVKAPKIRTRSAPPPRRFAYRPADPYAPMPMGISKVKAPPQVCAVEPWALPCILPQPQMRQWEMSFQVLWARTRGTIAWPRNSWWYSGWWGWNNEIDLNDVLGIPGHGTLGEFRARYQFRPNWAVRYSVIATQLSGGQGWNWNWVGYQLQFGPLLLVTGQPYQSKWTHAYHRAGLVYDAIKTPRSVVSVFADWAYSEDRIELNCAWGCGGYGYNGAIFSKSSSMALVGLEYQRCLQTAFNGGTWSCDYKGGYLFLDDVNGWDVSAGLRYSIPLNCGRSGYAKGGYRLVDIKKSQQDLLFNNAVEGGFLEFGFIF